MDIIRVDKADVIERLRANRETHRATYLEAMEGWRALAAKKLRALAERLENGEAPSDLFVRLDRPEDHTDDYDTALEMLKLSVQAEVDMTRMNFQNYIQDKWGWSEKFRTTTSLYNNG